MIRIPYEELYNTFFRVLLKIGFEQPRAELCARLFAETTLDGVYSHGVNRFPRFIETIRSGVVDIRARPELLSAHGALEQWNGNRGPGNLNAHVCMDRAISIARAHGIGCVALQNTNHWMRAGSYGRQAADAGLIGICWTNTLANLPPWGTSEPRLGNNPLVIAVPHSGGHVVLDMAMSQFSYGTLESYRKRHEELPVVGGFDSQGEPTRDPGAIEQSQRSLPIGYWKGSGLALMLDLVATLLSGGLASHQIDKDPVKESGLSQVFIAANLPVVDKDNARDHTVARILESLRGSGLPATEEVRYPGTRTAEIRRENLAQGIPVDPQIWKQVRSM